MPALVASASFLWMLNDHFGKLHRSVPFTPICAKRSFTTLFLLWGVPCIPIFIWFIKSISCHYKKVKCEKERGEGGERCCMVFYTSENVLSAWRQTILVLLNTAVSRQLNMIVSRIISDCRNELGAIFKMTFSLSFSFLLPCVVVCRGLYIDVPSQEIHFSLVFSPCCFVQETGPCFHFIVGYFFFLINIQ